MSFKKSHLIALIQGGSGLEQDISLLSAKAVKQALDELSYKYFIAPADKNLPNLLLKKKPDVAFLAVHGPYGEDGITQSLCEYLKIPYTGSGVLASSLCMDKLFCKNILLQNKIPTPDFQKLTSDKNIHSKFTYPFIVKASHGGSSLGTSLVKTKKDFIPSYKKAKKIGLHVFIEEYLDSCQELACSLLNGLILTPVEIQAKGGFYNYKTKYTKGGSSYFTPPRCSPLVTEKVKLLAQQVFQILGVTSYGRVDILLKNNKAWVLEVNTLPGLTKYSLLPQSAKHDKISFTKLIQIILQGARLDYTC